MDRQVAKGRAWEMSIFVGELKKNQQRRLSRDHRRRKWGERGILEASCPGEDGQVQRSQMKTTESPLVLLSPCWPQTTTQDDRIASFKYASDQVIPDCFPLPSDSRPCMLSLKQTLECWLLPASPTSLILSHFFPKGSCRHTLVSRL